LRLLIDTHVLIWSRADPRQLTKKAADAIVQAEIVFVSVATAWEIAIKTSLGRLRLPKPVEAAISEGGFEHLPISLQHAAMVQDLPHHHGDPFDRMLIVQAIAENLVMVTRDHAFSAYGIPIIRA
jgi:PIN domain nuclease of toxin-antitoxin system